MLNAREVLEGGRSSKGGICVLRMEETFLAMVRTRGFWAACLYTTDLRSFSITFWRAIQTDGPCRVSLWSSSNSGLLLNTVV